MKKIAVIFILLFCGGLIQAQSKKELRAELEQLKLKVKEMEDEKKKNELNLEEPIQKLSYALGVSVGSNILKQVDALSSSAFMHAINDLQNDSLKLSELESNKYVQEEITRIMEEKAEKAKEAGRKYLEDNSKREGVTVLPSGLQYEVLQKGEGPLPKASDRVKVHYHGMLADGTVFDSSVERGEPATFGVTQVIQGWVEALQLMPVGSKWKLFIPSDLAYGERGAGGRIAPHSTLVFEVELLGIE